MALLTLEGKGGSQLNVEECNTCCDCQAWQRHLALKYKWSDIQARPKCQTRHGVVDLQSSKFAFSCLCCFQQVASQAGEASQEVTEAFPPLPGAVASLLPKHFTLLNTGLKHCDTIL